MKVIFKTTYRLRRFVKKDSGGTLAELAILVPFLAIMLAGVSEIGRFFQTYTTLSKATRTAARYLSNHPFTAAEQDRAKNLVVCGKLTSCAANDRLVVGIETTNVCIETTGTPTETVTVRIPRTSAGCGAPYMHRPIFDISALLHNSITLALPINPSTTMYHKSD
jgi:Flp pilus assembly pilin Flp